MKNSLIQWTHHTFNPWMGCRKVAPECDNCYIIHTPPFKFRGLTHGSQRVRTSESNWKEPARWDRAARVAKERHRVFCLSLGDWADGEVPNEWRDDLFAIIEATEHLDWLLLTKRPALAQRYLTKRYDRGLPDNIWMGVSAGVDASPVFSITSTIRFLSCEPMLRPLDESIAVNYDWIIFGFESGSDARRGQDKWIRDGLRFCRNYGITPFVKQLGTRPEFKDSHGGDPSEWPEDLRVREFPTLQQLGLAFG